MTERDDEGVPLWPDMREPFALFCDAQWVWVSTMGGVFRSGIDRTALEASARLLAVDLSPAIFADVRLMEDEALKYWSRKR